MFTKKTKTLALPLLVLALAAIAYGQQTQPTPSPADNYVTNTGFKNRVIEVRNRTPSDLLPVLKLLTSGFKGAQVSASNEFKTIIVRDFPENIAAIEDAVKRLDVAEAARPDIELRMHVLIASNSDSTNTQYPADLKDVVAQLQSTLAYKNYYLLTTIVQRTKESREPNATYIEGSGTADLSVPERSEKLSYGYNFGAWSLTLSQLPSGVIGVQLGHFSFNLAGSSAGGNAHIQSDVSMREGEKVVVGTAGLRDRALILVMTAKVVK
jgi:hypothetical protein